MKPLNGLLLVPNYDVPDGRVIPLKPRVFRDDSNFQAWYIFAREQPYSHFTEYEYNRLAVFRSAYERVTHWGAKLYPIFLATPSWISSTKLSGAAYPTDMTRWKQWIKDNVEFAKSEQMDIPFWDSWNEVDGIKFPQYLEMYAQEWEAVKEVNPNALLGGPSTPAENVSRTKQLIDQCVAKGQTLDIAAWHNFGGDPKQVGTEVAAIAQYRDQHSAAGIQQMWIEEYHPAGEAYNIVKLVNWLSALEDAGVDVAIKSTWHNANSLSDLLTCHNTEANNCVRNPNWWVMKAYSEMSGTRVGVVQGRDGNTAIASFDQAAGEAKILISGSEKKPVDLTLNLDSQPFSSSFIRIDKYKVTSTENDGLVLQSTETPSPSSDLTTDLSIGAGEVWLVVIKSASSAPGSFMPKTPDDGVPAGLLPTFTWTPASSAASYALQVSTQPDMSSPVVGVAGLKTTSYQVTTPLKDATTYYWRVAAVNASGVTLGGSGVVYTFLASAKENIPVGRFSLQLPANNEVGTALTPVIAWTGCYGATSYRLQVATDSSFTTLPINTTGTFTQVTGASGMVAFNYTPEVPLKANTTYYARVYAVNENGSRIMNGPVHVFTTMPDGNPVPFVQQFPANKSSGVPLTTQLKWGSSNGSFFYKLEVSTVPNFAGTVFTRDDIITPSYTVEPHLLSPNTVYYWRVTGLTKDRAHSIPSSNGGIYFRTDSAEDER